jgi:hypothetical protein
MNFFSSIRPLAVCLALGACVTSATAEYVEYDAVGVPRLFKAAAAGGALATVVYGDPSGATEATFDASVVDAMGDHVWGTKSNFTLIAPEAARDSYRVVMLFSGVRHYGGKAACRDGDTDSLVPAGDAVSLQAAFCHDDKVLSQAHMRFDANQAGGNAMAATESAIAQAVLAIFPLHDKSREAPDVVVPPP